MKSPEARAIIKKLERFESLRVLTDGHQSMTMTGVLGGQIKVTYQHGWIVCSCHFSIVYPFTNPFNKGSEFIDYEATQRNLYKCLDTIEQEFNKHQQK